jgi:pectate lyase
MSYLDILSQREGWGDQTTGGKDGTVYHVTTLADSGSGSLRAACESTTPYWIVFDVSGKIVPNGPIYVKSNKTIDGRGQKIVLGSPNPLRIYDASNVILLNLTIDPGNPNWKLDGEGGDGLTVSNASNIWVHHCLFQYCHDGCLDMLNTSLATLSWNRFFFTRQAVALAGDKITLAHNYVYQVFARFPKMNGGFCHSYNNAIRGWGHYGIQAVKEGGHLLGEYNMFYPDANVFDGLPICTDVNRVEVTGGKINCSDVTQYEVRPTTFVGGKDSVDGSKSSDSRAKAKISKPADNALLDKTRWGAGPTLTAPTAPLTLEQRVAALEAWRATF